MLTEVVKNPRMVEKRCERLGCPDPKVYYPMTCPHSGLNLLVCGSCRKARELWAELVRNGESRIHLGRWDDERVPTVSS